MNKYRFHEILKAHAKGEDLSAFVPKNIPEAQLLASLKGGAGSSGGSGMPADHPYNNPDLPKLYYGMNLMNKKLYIDFPKLAEYCKTTGIVDVTKVLKSMGSAGVGINLFTVGIITVDKQFETQSMRFSMDGVSPTSGWSEILGYSYADNNMTIEELFQSYGVVSRDMSSYGLSQEGYVVALLVDILQCTNLNENPIDWLWFE